MITNKLYKKYLSYRLRKIQDDYKELMIQGYVIEAYSLYPQMFLLEDKINSL